MNLRNVIAFVVLALASSAVPARADVIWLQREDVAAALSIQWTGQDGVRRSDRDSQFATLASGDSDFLQVCARTSPSATDNTEASFCSAYSRWGSSVEANVNGAIVEGEVENEIVHRNQLGFLLKFEVEGSDMRLGFRQHQSGGMGAVDLILFNHTQNRVEEQVINNQTPGRFESVALLDGNQYSLIVRLSSKSPQGIEYGFEATFESESGCAVEVLPEPPDGLN